MTQKKAPKSHDDYHLTAAPSPYLKTVWPAFLCWHMAMSPCDNCRVCPTMQFLNNGISSYVSETFWHPQTDLNPSILLISRAIY